MWCPNCDRETNDEVIKENRSFDIKNESITIEVQIHSCVHCKEEWSADGFDPFDAAYRKYREEHMMVQPEELKEWRKDVLNFTQEEPSRLLGWSEATVVRYEKGALQERSHDNALKMAMVPAGLSVLLANDVGLEKEKVSRLMVRLNGESPHD